MSINYKIIVVTPSGRERYLSMLYECLKKQKDHFDEWHLWENTQNDSDKLYLYELEKENDFIKVISRYRPKITERYKGTNRYICRFYDYVIDMYSLTYLKSGYYGDPPSCKAYLPQMIIWCLICCSEKLITAAIVIMPFYNYLDNLSSYIEKPLKDYPQLELVLVMVIGPAIINSIFFWVCDNIIKNKQK